MDRACEGDETRRLFEEIGMAPVVPPTANRKADRETCKFRNEIERLFRRFKGCRRIFTRFDKLDVTFMGFLDFAHAVELIYDLAWTGLSFRALPSVFAWRRSCRLFPICWHRNLHCL